jgi:hypothetical protein
MVSSLQNYRGKAMSQKPLQKIAPPKSAPRKKVAAKKPGAPARASAPKATVAKSGKPQREPKAAKVKGYSRDGLTYAKGLRD